MKLPSWVIEEVEAEAEVRPEDHRPLSCKEPSSNTEFSADEVAKLISFLNKTKSSQGLNSNQLNNIVPEFDPSSKSQSIDSWLNKVNECSSIYDWDGKQTVHFALQKLTGLAKKWLEALPTVVYSWCEWQVKLRKAFPNEQNYGRLLEEMLNRTTRSNESLREYFYDKLSLINRCEIVGKKAVDCVVHGIADRSIRTGAQALNCGEPEDLLNYLSSQGIAGSNQFVKKRLESISSSQPANNVSQFSSENITCFNCKEKGHSFNKCPKPITKCQKCHRVGHDFPNCRLEALTVRMDKKVNPGVERQTFAISTSDTSNDKFYK